MFLFPLEYREHAANPQFPRKAPNVARLGRSGRLLSRKRTTRLLSCEVLNGLLADSMVLYGHYNKYGWLVRRQGFQELDRLFDKQAAEQRESIDLIVERVRILGGVATVPRQVAELTVMSRLPIEAQEVPEMLARLLESHALIIGRIREGMTVTASSGDDATNYLLSGLLRRQEQQVRCISESLGDDVAMSA
ncbi:MAG: DNA starvation/stationary phase protection protein [Acidimicrobiales bacterium]|jgi:starvation-inducible DNA-binding protein